MSERAEFVCWACAAWALLAPGTLAGTVAAFVALGVFAFARREPGR